MNDPAETLKSLLVNSDLPSGIDGLGWKPGQQLLALRFYLDPSVRVLANVKEHEHEGHVQAVLEYEDFFYLWHDTFGDDEHDDVLGGGCKHDGHGYIERTLHLNQVRAFDSLDKLIAFCHWPDAEALNWSENRFEPLLRKLEEFKRVHVTTPVRVFKDRLETPRRDPRSSK